MSKNRRDSRVKWHSKANSHKVKNQEEIVLAEIAEKIQNMQEQMNELFVLLERMRDNTGSEQMSKSSNTEHSYAKFGIMYTYENGRVKRALRRDYSSYEMAAAEARYTQLEHNLHQYSIANNGGERGALIVSWDILDYLSECGVQF